MQGFNDHGARVDENGNLSLGWGGYDDGAAHATYKYAKNDVTFDVSADQITGDTLPALTYATGDIPKRTLVAATTHKVTIPFPQRFNRSTSSVSPTGGGAPLGQISSAGHGILIKSMALFYRVNTADLTSITAVINHTTLAAAAGLPTVTALTTTVAGGTLTQAANVYALVTTVTTPAWLTTDDLMLWGLATIVTPAMSTCDLIGASWRCALAIY